MRQKSVTNRVPCALIWFRAEPATEFAPLSHMLINGFFFIQGLVIFDSFNELIVIVELRSARIASAVALVGR